MVKEIFITIFGPLIFITLPYYFFNKWKEYKRLSIFEKYIFNLSIATAFLIISLSFFGYFSSSGFKNLSLIFFWGGIFCLGFFTISNFKKIRLSPPVGEFDFSKKDSLSKIFFLIIFLFLAKVFLFSLFKPIIDPDVVNSYIPFARTIFLSDRIPERNYYDNSLMMFPPIGGSVIYAWFYSLTNNIFTESFRLLPFIYILGIIICTYKIAKLVIDEKLAKLSLIIFLIFPFWDEYLFESLFYPDIIALFLFLSFFYFFLKENYFKNFRKEKILYYLFISLFLGGTLLFKIQYFIAYYFLGLLFIIYLLPKKWWSNFLLLFGCLPILYRLQRGVGYQLFSHLIVFIFTVLIYLLLVLIFNQKNKEKKASPFAILILFFGLTIGGLIHLRNHFLHGSFLSPVSQKTLWVYEILKSIGVSGKSQLQFLELVIFLLPAFAYFWLFPKIFGAFEFFKKDKTRILLLFIFVWYAVISLLFDLPNPRSLMPIFPFLAILIALGIGKIEKILKVNPFSFRKSFILLSLFFSLFSSTFLWWNGGLLLFGPLNLRKTLTTKTIKAPKIEKKKLYSEGLTIIKNMVPADFRSGIDKTLSKAITHVNFNNVFSKITDFSIILTARGEFYKKYFRQLVFLTIISSILLIALSYLLAKISISFKTAAVLIFTFYFLPYLLTFLIVSKGKIWEFKKIESEELYNFWGQTKYVVPYLKEKAKSDDKVVFWGIPTGLSYYTNLRVYNLLYSYSLGETFKEIFYEKDLGKIYRFYKKNGFKYIIISSYPEPYSQFKQIKEMTKIFDILENKKYASLVIQPTEEIFWYVYRLK